MLQIQPLFAATLNDIITKSSNSLQTQDFNGTNKKQASAIENSLWQSRASFAWPDLVTMCRIPILNILFFFEKLLDFIYCKLISLLKSELLDRSRKHNMAILSHRPLTRRKIPTPKHTFSFLLPGYFTRNIPKLQRRKSSVGESPTLIYSRNLTVS